MRTQLIGTSSLRTSRLGYGCMRIAGCWKPEEVGEEQIREGKAAVVAAYEAGYRLFDHADVYCRGKCEEIFGKVLRDVSGMRDSVVVATKCGVRPPGKPHEDSPYRYDFSAGHILRSADRSLKRLGIDTIDLYQLHRPDLLMNPEEVATAFEQLRQEGKVREFGVSNFSPSQLRLLQSALGFPLVVHQVEVSLATLDRFEDGSLDQCLERHMTPLAWSPLWKGVLAAGGKVKDDHPGKKRLDALLALLDDLAGNYGTTRTNIALAFLLRHPSRIVPLVGSSDPDHIRDAARADEIDLSREDWYRLYEAARGKRLP